MEPDVQADIEKLQARLALAGDALMQMSEQLLTASSNIIVLKAVLGVLVNLSPPEVREVLAYSDGSQPGIPGSSAVLVQRDRTWRGQAPDVAGIIEV